MALPMPANVNVTVYRTANPGAPYTFGAQVYASLPGYLVPVVHTGRFGSATWLKWTHMLMVGPGNDIRDAYNSQLDPARDNTKADTIVLQDSVNQTNPTAYYVVFVEQIGRGTASEYLRVYLDRFAPTWPSDAL
jgi:hypothetical protein